MKRQILFVQGGGEGTHDEWDNKLVDSLERNLGEHAGRRTRCPACGSELTIPSGGSAVTSALPDLSPTTAYGGRASADRRDDTEVISVEPRPAPPPTPEAD